MLYDSRPALRILVSVSICLEDCGLGLEASGLGLGLGLEASGLGLGLKACGLGLGLEGSGLVNTLLN